MFSFLLFCISLLLLDPVFKLLNLERTIIEIIIVAVIFHHFAIVSVFQRAYNPTGKNKINKACTKNLLSYHFLL